MSDRGHRRGRGSKLARTAPRPPIAILVAIVVSLPLFPYTWHMLLHILGAVLFLGNLIVTAGWMNLGGGEKDSRGPPFASAGGEKGARGVPPPRPIPPFFDGPAGYALS